MLCGHFLLVGALRARKETRLVMDWSWSVYFVALPIMIIISMFTRGAMNAQYVQKYGAESDYKAHPRMAIFGSLFGGAVWAAIITLVIGFL